MGNATGSFFAGLGQVVGNILGHPLDFLSGKSCDSVCASTWDFICFVENFCVSHLLKFAFVATLLYFVLLFVYLIFQLGICQCIFRSLCRITWACFAMCFSAFEFSCTYLCFKLRSVKRKRSRRKRDIEEFSTSEDEYELGETSRLRQPSTNLEHRRRSRFDKRKNCKNERLRRSLKPTTTHRASVGSARNSVYINRRKILKNIGDCTSPLHHHIRVSRSSKFLNKGSRRRRSGVRRRRKQV
ncbi:hypothetical protein ABFX02_05G086100 [Erythranthe guttata]